MPGRDSQRIRRIGRGIFTARRASGAFLTFLQQEGLRKEKKGWGTTIWPAAGRPAGRRTEPQARAESDRPSDQSRASGQPDGAPGGGRLIPEALPDGLESGRLILHGPTERFGPIQQDARERGGPWVARSTSRFTRRPRWSKPQDPARSGLERRQITRPAQHLVDFVEVEFLQHDHLPGVLLQQDRLVLRQGQQA